MKTKPDLSKRAILALSLPLFCAAALSVYGAITESNLTKTCTVQPGGQVIVDADFGSIDIRTGGQNEVNIEVRRSVKGASATKAQELFAAHEVTFDQDGNRVSVHAKIKEGARNLFNRGRNNLQVSFRLSVPKQFNLDLTTAAGSISSADVDGQVQARTAGGSLKFGDVKGAFDGNTSAGSIVVGDVTGPVLAKTSGGSITLGEIGAETRAETAAGSITIKAVKGTLAAHTAGGSVTLGEIAGPADVKTAAGSISIASAAAPLKAHTSGGSITIGDARDTVTAETSAGSITVAFSAQPHGDCRLATSGGHIEVKVPESVGFNLDAHASGGRVTTELPVTATIVGEHKRDVLQGKLNGGGQALVLKTSAGGIRLRKP